MIQQEISCNKSLTPLVAYAALRGHGSCLLEFTNEKIALIGIDPIGTFRSRGREIEIEKKGKKQSFIGDPYEALKEFSSDRKAFGCIDYNAIRLKESIPESHSCKGFPDFFFHLYRTVLIFEQDKQKIYCQHEGPQESLDTILKCCLAPVSLRAFKSPKPMVLHSDLSKKEYMDRVEQAKEYIKAGDIFQVVLSRTLQAEIHASPFEIYRALCQTSPSPYQFLFEEEEFAIVGASPELMLSVQGGMIESMPIAGTCARDQCTSELLESAKESAEHVMLVDLARNDVGILSLPGTVQVAEYKTVKSYSHVNHLVSRITGQLAPALHSLDAFKASFPAGTLSGAPKIRAMEIIDTLECSRREVYGGAIVYLDEKGDLLSCIAIRTALIRKGKAEIRVGAGIVLDSEAEKEFEETEHKARGVIAALELAEGGME